MKFEQYFEQVPNANAEQCKHECYQLTCNKHLYFSQLILCVLGIVIIFLAFQKLK